MKQKKKFSKNSQKNYKKITLNEFKILFFSILQKMISFTIIFIAWYNT